MARSSLVCVPVFVQLRLCHRGPRLHNTLSTLRFQSTSCTCRSLGPAVAEGRSTSGSSQQRPAPTPSNIEVRDHFISMCAIASSAQNRANGEDVRVGGLAYAALTVGDSVVALGAHDVAAALHAHILPTPKAIAPAATMHGAPVLAADGRRGWCWRWWRRRRWCWRRWARVWWGRPRRRRRWAPVAGSVHGPASGRGVGCSADGEIGRRLTRQQTAPRGGGDPSARLVQQQALGSAQRVADRAVANAPIHRRLPRQQVARPIRTRWQGYRPHCKWGLPHQTSGAAEQQQVQQRHIYHHLSPCHASTKYSGSPASRAC